MSAIEIASPIAAAEAQSADFSKLYTEHAPYVWRVLLRLGVPASDVEDVCQEVFVVVHRRLDSFDGRSAVRSWLYGIAFRCAAAWRRRAHRRHERLSADLDLRLSVAPDQLAALDVQDQRRVLESLLECLDADQRAVFVFFEIEALPMTEIATIMECPLQTGFSRLRAARERVAAAMARLRKRGQP